MPFFAIVIAAAAEHHRQGHASILAHPWLVRLGEASFSLYMVHALVQTAFFGVLKVLKLHNRGLPLSLAFLAVGCLSRWSQPLAFGAR